MYQMCTDCQNHYEDSSQVADCDPSLNGTGTPNPYHLKFATQPITEANHAAREARARTGGRATLPAGV